MDKFTIVMATCCQRSEGLKMLSDAWQAMPTQHAAGNFSSSGTTTWAEYQAKKQECNSYMLLFTEIDTIMY